MTANEKQLVLAGLRLLHTASRLERDQADEDYAPERYNYFKQKCFAVQDLIQKVLDMEER